MAGKYRVPYGQAEIDFDLPAGYVGRALESTPQPGLSDVPDAIREALRRPSGGPRLAALARPGMRVSIVVTDATRSSPDHLLVPPLLEELGAAGVPDHDVSIVVGIGLHRPSTPEDWHRKLGDSITARVRVINPRPTDPGDLVDLGVTAEGVPAVVNRTVVEADLVVATGIVEPHQYAGYSGGRKTVAIGASSEATIQHAHGIRMLEHPGVRLGELDGNPFHSAVTEIAGRAGLRFILNVVVNDAQQVVAVRAGDPQVAFLELVSIARKLYTVGIDGPADLIVAGVGYPKDSNLYQASRAASYMVFAPQPVVRKGGVIIVPARAEEGVGAGLGEQRFHEMMRSASSPSAIIDEARLHGYLAGAQRGLITAKVLEHCAVVVVGASDARLVRDLKMTPARTMSEALDFARERIGSTGIAYVVPHALLTLPVISG